MAQGIIEMLGIGHKFRQFAFELINGIRGLGSKSLPRTIHTMAKTIPDLFFEIAGQHKEGVRGGGVGGQNQNGIVFDKTGQIAQIAALAIGVMHIMAIS